MSEPRLKTGLWVRATLRAVLARGETGAVIRRGDEDAGSVLVVLHTGRDRLAVFSQTRTLDGEAAWIKATGSEPVDQSAVDAYVDRQCKRDPDLWVIEFDTGEIALPFDAMVLSS